MLCEGALEKPKFFCARIRSSNFFALLILPFTKSHFAHPTARRACGAKVWAGALLAVDTPKKKPDSAPKRPFRGMAIFGRKKIFVSRQTRPGHSPADSEKKRTSASSAQNRPFLPKTVTFLTPLETHSVNLKEI